MRWLRRLLCLTGLVLVVRWLILRRADANVEEPVRPAPESQWPPFEPSTPTGAGPADAAGTVETAVAPAPDPETVVDDTVALARPAPTWVVPDGGACPITHPVKVKASSGIFHVPGGRFYDRTVADRCYASAEDAAADGYRAAKA